MNSSGTRIVFRRLEKATTRPLRFRNCPRPERSRSRVIPRTRSSLTCGNPRVEAHIYTGLTGEFAATAGACAIIRGVRNTTDFEYERTMEATNHRIYPDIATVMLFTPSPVADISSSTVREVLSFGRTVEEFMPIGIDINKYL